MARTKERYLLNVLNVLTDSFLVGEFDETFSKLTNGLSEEMMRILMFALGYLTCEEAHYHTAEQDEDAQQADIDAFVDWFTLKAAPKLAQAIVSYEERKKRM